jgi:hypothetical protein
MFNFLRIFREWELFNRLLDKIVTCGVISIFGFYFVIGRANERGKLMLVIKMDFLFGSSNRIGNLCDPVESYRIPSNLLEVRNVKFICLEKGYEYTVRFLYDLYINLTFLNSNAFYRIR